MNDEAWRKLQQPVAAWSDGPGMNLATALVERHQALLPRQITNAQLSGLNGVVQAVDDVNRVMAFAQHQGTRAALANKEEVQAYWDDLRDTLGRLEDEAARLLSQAGLSAEALPDKGKRPSRAPARLTLWLAQEFVQHLIVHSLYIGKKTQRSKKR